MNTPRKFRRVRFSATNELGDAKPFQDITFTTTHGTIVLDYAFMYEFLSTNNNKEYSKYK